MFSLRPAKSKPKAFVAGMDVGGTKVHIADTLSTTTWRYVTSEYPDMYALLDSYFEKMGDKPHSMAVAMAGVRNDDTGEIKMTNSSWPAFDPQEAEKRYPGITFTTMNDMVGTMAGVLEESTINLKTLKSGSPTKTGTKLVVTISTGLGVGVAAWDGHTKRFVCLASEAGHGGFQPKSEHEMAYLNFLHKKYPHASAELAVAGKHGIDNLIDHCFQDMESPELKQAIDRARQNGRPTGAVLLEYATEGSGEPQKAAQYILEALGAIIGGTLADLLVSYRATGGIYLTGSVSLALGEYLAENTEMLARFARPGSVLSHLAEQAPIYLLTNPNIAVNGALNVAKQQP